MLVIFDDAYGIYATKQMWLKKDEIMGKAIFTSVLKPDSTVTKPSTQNGFVSSNTEAVPISFLTYTKSYNGFNAFIMHISE